MRSFKRVIKSTRPLLIVVLAMVMQSNASHANLTRGFHTLTLCAYKTVKDEERSTLALWILYAFTSHPQITRFGKIPPEKQRKAVDAEVAELLRSITQERCESLFKDIPERHRAEARLELIRRFADIGFEAIYKADEIQSSLNKYKDHPVLTPPSPPISPPPGVMPFAPPSTR